MAEVLHFSATRDQEGLAALTEQVEQALENRALSPKIVFALQLVVDELVSNIVRHGTGAPSGSLVSVRLLLDPERAGVEIESVGDCFNPFERAEPEIDQSVEERPIGGLGIHLTRKVMDECQHTYRDGRNVLVLGKKLGLDGAG
jgi:serine/threonine-protein kinase RsbW